ncbi:MAG: NAD(P)-dependent oxidoreductase [Verrucomicrobiota bacterium]
MRIFLTGASGFIGTNYLNDVLEKGWEPCNFDHSPPTLEAHRSCWVRGDILDAEALKQAMADFAPEAVLHLAARTDCDENTTVKQGYRTNTHGTAHLLAAIQATPSVRRAVITSSQFVCGPGRLPEHDEDYFPHTVYGQSKVETEQLTRASNLDCCWTLIRPTNIWGPYHARYGKEFWRIVALNLYLHPGLPTPTRCYGYVGNIIWQINRLLERNDEEVCGQTFYVGDRPTDIIHWIEGFHRELTGREKLLVMPPWVLRSIAKAGDGISAITGKPFYLTSSRLHSMSTDYLTPMDKTFDTLGEPPFSLEEGIRASANWYREQKQK